MAPSFSAQHLLPFSAPVSVTSPPYTDHLSDDATMPPMPIVLDPTMKVPQIIVDIKARAYAATLLSSETSPSFEFKDELWDSIDDEMLPFVLVPGKGKRYSSHHSSCYVC